MNVKWNVGPMPIDERAIFAVGRRIREGSFSEYFAEIIESTVLYPLGIVWVVCGKSPREHIVPGDLQIQRWLPYVEERTDEDKEKQHRGPATRAADALVNPEPVPERTK